MERNARDFLYLIWKESQSRRNFIIGRLIRQMDGYSFEYGDEVKEALKKGFSPLVPFPEINKVYFSQNMFPVFSSRLPDKKRKGIEQILNKYGLSEYDEYELLKTTGARLPIDTFSFVSPIFPDDENVKIEFCAMGIRHYIGCNGESCAKGPELLPGQMLQLIPQSDNAYDNYAVRLVTPEGCLIGYIPRYYSQAVYKKLSEKYDYECKVLEFSKEKNCDTCLKVSLKIPKTN